MNLLQNRIMRDASLTLRQEAEGTVLGPVTGALIKRVIMIGAPLEAVAFVGIILYFTIGPGDMESNMILMVGLLMAVGAAMGLSVIGAMVYEKTSAQQKRRFFRDTTGGITVKDESGGDLVLSGGTPAFTVESTTDRDGNEVHDVLMRYNNDSHYILSGTDRDDMVRLCEALQNACAR